MNFGNLSGLVNGTEQVVFDYEVAGSAVSSISTGNILNGDEDGWYTIIVRGIFTGTNQNFYLDINGDSTSGNYGARFARAVSTAVADDTSYTLFNNGATGSTGFFVGRLYAKSGAVRLIDCNEISYATGTTIDRILSGGLVWTNTTDNITSMTFRAGQTNGCGIGTRIIILKSNNFTNGTPTGIIKTPYIKGAWYRVGSTVLGAPASSVIFSSLDGDRDVLYYLSTSQKATGALYTQLTFNADSGANYGYQQLKGASTTVSASRGTGQSFHFNIGDTFSANEYAQTNDLIFAKSGFIRPSIHTEVNKISGTTVSNIYTIGNGWNNSPDNITSIKLTASASTYMPGSQFDLYALRPNG